jgi:alginate O-acetyltransferase complex protein AlgJ
MTRISKYWWLLIIGVLIIQLLLLTFNRFPNIKNPDLSENRVLATFPAMPHTFGELEKFRVGLDLYIGDNFPTRRNLIAGLNFIRYQLGYSGTSRVIVGKDGWLFYDDGSHLSQIRKSNLSASQITEWVSTFGARVEAIKQIGGVYILISPPVKERVYPERLPGWLGNAESIGDADVLAKASRRAAIDSFVDLHGPLVAARAAGLAIYSPYDTHWSGEGAYVAYAALIRSLNDRGLNLSISPRTSFNVVNKPREKRPQDLAHMLGIASMVEQTYIELEEPANLSGKAVQYLTQTKDWTGDRVIDTGHNGPILLFMGDSFSSALIPLISQNFSRIIFAHHQNGFHRQDLIDKFKPTVVVLEILEAGLRHSMSPTMRWDRRQTASLFPVVSQAVAASPSSDSSRIPAKRIAAIKNLSADNSTHQCNVEKIIIKKGPNTIRVSAEGWFADIQAGRTVDDIQVVLETSASTWSITTPININREDVAQFFKNKLFARSGFVVESEVGLIPDGIYKVYLKMNNGDKELTCVTNISVPVSD